ncbi:MAG: hypothetical protein ABL921_20980 [Pirellula sp.]
MIASRSLLFLSLLTATICAQEVRRSGAQLSPFRGMRAIGSGIEVQIADDTWFALERIGGVDTSTLLRESERLYGILAWKRLSEDLPELLKAMGQTVGEAIDLEVRDLRSATCVRTVAVVGLERSDPNLVSNADSHHIFSVVDLVK